MQLLRPHRGTRPSIARHRLAIATATATAALALAATAAPTFAATSPTGPPTIGVGPTANPGRVSATLAACHTAADLTDRYATFAAQMVATPATQQMALRLQLFVHTPGIPGYRLLTNVPGFGVWESSATGIGVFSYSQEVTSLTAPASFRVQVGYRWFDANHRVIKRASRTTAPCAESAQLANLVAGSLSIEPGPLPGSATYAVAVRNDGALAAGPFAVGLTIDGVPLAGQTVAQLDPGSRIVVDFTGPTCAAGGTLGITVDPANAIQETTKVDDTRIVTCA